MKINQFKKEGKQLSLFITAGFPQLDSTCSQILKLQQRGIDFIEVGIPFSDPMADGPTIQDSSRIALENGMNLSLLFDQLNSIKEKVKVPLVLMGYLNPVLQFGVERFLVECRNLGIASVILPDLSLEIYKRFYKELFESYGISVSFLITPLSSDARIVEIARACSGSFVYLVSNNSITGEKHQMVDAMGNRYSEIKNLCADTPVMMGFGISTIEDVRNAQQFCDGAIIGSAFLNAVKRKEEEQFLESVCV